MDPIAFIVLISFVCLVAFIVLFNSFFTEKKNRKLSENFDVSKRHFYFLLETDKENSIEKLSIKGINDTLDYFFDTETMNLTFTLESLQYNFKLSFYKFQTYSYMVASRETPITSGNFPLQINTFFGKKLNTTPVEVYYFEALLKNNNIVLK